MSSKIRLSISALMGFTCLSVGLPVAADTLPASALNPSARPEMPRPHGLATSIAALKLNAPAPVVQSQPASSSAGKIATASDSSVTEGTFANNRTVANDAAKDSAAGAGTCEAYFTQSQAMSTSLINAFKAMSAGDKAGQAAALPALQSQLNGLLPYEIKAEICGGNHINAYTDYQYFQLSTLRERGVDTGLPANLPLVKQPDLNHSAVAYATGWIKFEQSDFDGALAAFNKGLALYPHEHSLQSEKIAALMQLGRAAEVVSYIDTILSNTHDLTDAERAKMFAARGLGLVLTGNFQGADDSFTVSLRYSWSDDVDALQKELRAAVAQAPK